MMPEEDNIFGAFSEYPLVPLEGVPTYEYMTNLTVYLNSCSSAVDCTLGCKTLGCLVLTAQPAVFNTHCVTKFITPINPGICPFMPDPAPIVGHVALARTGLRWESGHTTCYLQWNHTRTRSSYKYQTNNREPPITSRYQADK